MDQSEAFSLGVQVGEMMHEFSLVLHKEKDAASGRVLVAGLNMIIRGIHEDPNDLSGVGLSEPEEAAKTLEHWVERLVDERDLPKDASYDTVTQLYSDLELYFGDALRTMRAGIPDQDSEIL